MYLPLSTFEFQSIFTKLGMYIMKPKLSWTAYFINTSHQSVCVSPCIVARQRLVIHVPTARNTCNNRRIVGRVVLYAIRAVPKERRRIVLPRTCRLSAIIWDLSESRWALSTRSVHIRIHGGLLTQRTHTNRTFSSISTYFHFLFLSCIPVCIISWILPQYIVDQLPWSLHIQSMSLLLEFECNVRERTMMVPLRYMSKVHV
jgi:hypothetical protein